MTVTYGGKESVSPLLNMLLTGTERIGLLSPELRLLIRIHVLQLLQSNAPLLLPNGKIPMVCRFQQFWLAVVVLALFRWYMRALTGNMVYSLVLLWVPRLPLQLFQIKLVRFAVIHLLCCHL